MMMNKPRRGPASASEAPPEDPTAWLVHGTLADIVLMNTYYIKCMVILAYTFLHGTCVGPGATRLR
jgi:hypothetical protein